MRFGGMGGGQGGARLAGAVAGEIVAKDDTSITIKLRDGGSRIVFTASSTTVGKMSVGTLADLANGANVMVMGTPNGDGSLTAGSIQVRPAGDTGMPMMGGMAQPRETR
jgi:predicted ribosome-associated RNA-binding protein Tma20